jgi:hypothetical protein
MIFIEFVFCVYKYRLFIFQRLFFDSAAVFYAIYNSLIEIKHQKPNINTFFDALIDTASNLVNKIK